MKKIKILIIDDEEPKKIANLLSDFTFRLTDFTAEKNNLYSCEIETAESPEEALCKIEKSREIKEFYDVLIIDMVMGSGDNCGEAGISIFEKILLSSSVKIILTANASTPSCVKAMKSGAFDYLEKNVKGAYDKLRDSMKRGLEERLQPQIDTFMSWFNDNLKTFIETYDGKYIAVLEYMVVDSDFDYDAVSKRVKEKYPFYNAVVIQTPKKEDMKCISVLL